MNETHAVETVKGQEVELTCEEVKTLLLSAEALPDFAVSMQIMYDLPEFPD